MNKKRNENIQKELKVIPMVKKMKKYRRNLREHVERMDDDRSPKLAGKGPPQPREDLKEELMVRQVLKCVNRPVSLFAYWQ